MIFCVFVRLLDLLLGKYIKESVQEHFGKIILVGSMQSEAGGLLVYSTVFAQPDSEGTKCRCIQ